MSNQARDERGQFACGGNSGEAAARDNGRNAVTMHAEPSVGTKTGRLLSFGQPTPNPAKGQGLSTAAAEKISLGKTQDNSRHGR